jgi:hypothetical protein
MKHLFSALAFGSAFALAATAASAQSGNQNGSMSGGSMSHPQGAMSGSSMGKTTHSMESSNGSMHSMPATVTSVDQKTGVVEVNTEGMGLKLHFPPTTLANVKAGDKITLKMGFSKS